MRGDVTVGAPERRRIVPILAVGFAAEASVADAIRIGSGTRIQGAARDRERESGVRRDHAAGLPPAQNCLDQTLGVAEYRQVLDGVEYPVVGHVKTLSPAAPGPG